MSNEEAISELETIKRVYANMRKEYKPCVEALQMAVDLLKQADTPQTERTCEDCSDIEEWYTFRDEQEYNARHGKE